MAGEFDTTSEDIAEAFARIEDDLLESMTRNLKRHGANESAEGFDWVQWQAQEIAELERYARENGLRYGPEFDALNERIDDAIRQAYGTGYADAEAQMLEAAMNGADIARDSVLRLPQERMDVIARATHDDMMRAEYATLRRARDIYRKTIFDAQVYATSGATTYGKAIDMAIGDFLVKGIDGITYRNGSRHSIVEYSRMAVRTAAKRAALTAEGDARRDWGVHTVFVNYRVDACPECMQWVGRVLVDDVYGGGTAEESKETGYPLLSDAMAQGLFHPNCRDTCSTYFEGISELPDKPTAAERERAERAEAEEQRVDAAALNAERYGRASLMSLDMDDRRHYAELADAWQAKAEEAARSSAADIAEALEGTGLSAKQAKEVAEIVGTADTTAATVFERYLPSMRFDNLRAKSGGAYFMRSTQGITLNAAQVAQGNTFEKPWETLFHEFGHLIDNAAASRRYGFLSLDKDFGEAVKREAKAYANAIKKEKGLSRVAEAWDWIADDVTAWYREDPRSIGGVSDLLGAASGRGHLGYLPGHRKSYWTGSEALENIGTEAFAEFFECEMCNPEALARMKQYFPESYDLFRKMLEELARG